MITLNNSYALQWLINAYLDAVKQNTLRTLAAFCQYMKERFTLSYQQLKQLFFIASFIDINNDVIAINVNSNYACIYYKHSARIVKL